MHVAAPALDAARFAPVRWPDRAANAQHDSVRTSTRVAKHHLRTQEQERERGMSAIDIPLLFIATDMRGVVGDLQCIPRPHGPSEHRGGGQPASNGSDR
jgi:hypothetical protein